MDELRKLILKLSYQAKVGHIGSALSIIDIVWCLYDGILKVSPKDFTTNKNNDRDRFVLSKGHAALALYVVLQQKGFISEADLNTYCQNDSKLGVHPKTNIQGVDFSSGSLGQGVNYAVGSALAAKIQNSKRKIYCLISDAELNEGCVWEGFMFATHHQLNNLVFILDNNKQQALGKTEEVIKIDNIEQRMADFGFKVFAVNGHNHEQLKNLFKQIESEIEETQITQPIFINAHTVCGKGVSYMAGTIEWHYKSMSDEQYQLALQEL